MNNFVFSLISPDWHLLFWEHRDVELVVYHTKVAFLGQRPQSWHLRQLPAHTPAPHTHAHNKHRDITNNKNSNNDKFVWQQSINIYVLERLAASCHTCFAVSLTLPLSSWRAYLQDTSIFVSCRSSSSRHSCVCSRYRARQHSNDYDKSNNTQSQLRLGR